MRMIGRKPWDKCEFHNHRSVALADGSSVDSRPFFNAKQG